MALATILAGGAVVVSVLSFHDHTLQGRASVKQMATTQAGSAPQGGGAKSGPTARYNREVHHLNATKARQAIKSGGSFVPTPAASAAPITLPSLNTLGVVAKKPAPAPTSRTAPGPVAVKPSVPPPAVSVNTNQEDPTGKFMDTVMTQWMRAQVPKVSVWVATTHARANGGTITPAHPVPGVAGKLKPFVASPLRVGHIYYAVNLLAANSDHPGTPVLAEVVSGSLAGARFIGGFKLEDNRLLLEFSEVVVHGKVWKTTAFGVDPSTAQPSLATRVDHHYLGRWGGLVAASFLEGFGRAVRQSGSTMTQFAGGNGISTVYATRALNTKAETEIALGKVGQKIGEQLDKGFNRPPTVYLRKGIALGLLVLKR